MGLDPMSSTITILIAEYKAALEKAVQPDHGKANMLDENNAHANLEYETSRFGFSVNTWRS
jgi:hypothetical protein